MKTDKYFEQHFGCCRCCTRLATFTQHSCTRACALGPLVARQGPGAHKPQHVALKMLKMLPAFGQPVQHVATSSNEARRCVEMLRALGQALRVSTSL